ncbi:MAG: kdsC [Vampirovibrio sp.]|jgi:3-deoxy-D-manno-octulosonate 8-phosphate phosphatase (KDO 8-P phosphatase)|nr:kdsC [Vampirovibrio sp.]
MLAGTKLLERAAAIQLVVMDVDGVLTDGKITYTSDDQEIKSFNVKDGLGISLGVRAGIQFAIITARESLMVQRRAEDLNIQHVIQKTRTKLPAFEKLVQDLGLSFEQTAYIGDDLPDLPPMQMAGLACCPADAAGEVKAIAHLVANHRGGEGAVREILEFMLECRQMPQNLVAET